MTPSLRSDGAALEHILAVILDQAAPSTYLNTIPPFRACFTESGVDSASDFITMTPAEYATVPFSTSPDGAKDTHLNMVQTKKLSSLFSWFRQVENPPPSRWFDLTADDFKAWHSQAPAEPGWVQVPAPGSTTLATSATVDFARV